MGSSSSIIGISFDAVFKLVSLRDTGSDNVFIKYIENQVRFSYEFLKIQNCGPSTRGEGMNQEDTRYVYGK